MNNYPVTEEEFEELYQAACAALEFAQAGPHGDLCMTASRAAGLAVSAIMKALDEKRHIVVSAKDLDAMLNGEGQEAWAAEGRLRDALNSYAARQGVPPATSPVPASPTRPRER